MCLVILHAIVDERFLEPPVSNLVIHVLRIKSLESKNGSFLGSTDCNYHECLVNLYCCQILGEVALLLFNRTSA